MIAALLALSPVPGQKLAPINLIDESFKPAVWKPGRRTVVTFVAMWCDTWRVQEPRLQKVRKATTGVDFLTVSVDGRYRDVPEAPIIWADPKGKVVRKLGIDRVPYTLVVDESGTVCLARTGILRAADILASLRNPVESGTTYLTFDDFPPKKGGDELLDVLRKEGVKATFFCIGENAEERPELVRRAVREGHSIQVHAWDHDGKYDFQRCADYLKKLGASPRLIRAPGSEKITALKGDGWKGATVDPYDYRRPGVAELERRILYAAKPGAAIQLHAGVDQTEEVLSRVIASLRNRSYRFGVIE
ncbi:hypothetical protein EON81_03290 [bacterium]|nr:MAG: hypothetical protein EON81_03290 [bacterium]